MNIFIVHYKPLQSRKHHMDQQLQQLTGKFSVIYVDQFDRNALPKTDIPVFDSRLDGAQRAIALSHFHILREIVRMRMPYALVLEDDALFDQDFLLQLQQYIDMLPTQWDMLFVGDGCNLHAATHGYTTPCVVPRNLNGGHTATRCLDSYVISAECASKLIHYLDYSDIIMKKPVDHFYNELAKYLHLRVFWAEPTIVTQGSQNDTFDPSHSTLHVQH